MAYKGVIFDVDGTTVPLGAMEADPETQAAIEENREVIHLCAATGRSAEFARPILKSLGLVDPCVIMGGSAIVDPQSFEVLWEKTIDAAQVEEVAKILKGFEAQLFICKDASQESEQVEDIPTRTPLVILYALAMKPAKALSLIEELDGIDNVAAHSTPSWDEGMVDVHITHAEGTKEHGIYELKRLIGLTAHELVGVGDSGNDMPIFRAVGHRVAVGNASPELINLADEVAPSLEEHGLVSVINRVAAGVSS